MITASAFGNLVPIVASVLILISLILIYVVKSQWTNVLAHEMFCSSLNSKFADLKRGTDEKSTQVLDYTQQVLYHSLFWNKRTNLYSLWNISYIKLPHFQYVYKKQWLSQRDSIDQECNARGIEKIFPEDEFFKHGLATCNEKILEHIRNHDIFDLGAYVGDSALILSEYTNHTVFSFELSHKTASKFREIMQKNDVKNVVLTEMGISDTKQEIYFSDTGKLNSGAGSTGTTKAILTTVDNEVDRLQAKVGFIKADLEGYGLKAIHGAIETIKRYRPVISIGIYHNYEELFEIKPFMEKNVEISILCDLYGNLLTKKQLKFIDDYYNNDLSLSEIAENEKITRQAARDNIKKGEKKLFEYEEKLQFMKRMLKQEKKIEKILFELTKIQKDYSDEEVADMLEHVKKELNCLV